MKNQIKIKVTFVMVSGVKLESDFQICSKFYIYFPDDFEYCRELSRCIEYSDQKGKVFIQIDKVCIWHKKKNRYEKVQVMVNNSQIYNHLSPQIMETKRTMPYSGENPGPDLRQT